MGPTTAAHSALTIRGKVGRAWPSSARLIRAFRSSGSVGRVVSGAMKLREPHWLGVGAAAVGGFSVALGVTGGWGPSWAVAGAMALLLVGRVEWRARRVGKTEGATRP